MSLTHPPTNGVAGTRDRKGLNGWHVLAMFVAFFAVVFAVDGGFMVMAYRTHPGEVSVTPYEDGLLYDKQIAQMKAQAALGWTAAASADNGVVTLEVRDASRRPVTGLAIVARMERPATETGRLTPRFRETAPGVYQAAEAGLAGAWDLTAEARDGAGHVFVAERRLTWP